MEIFGLFLIIFILLYGVFGFFTLPNIIDNLESKNNKTKIIVFILLKNILAYFLIFIFLLAVAFNLYLFVLQILFNIFIYYLIIFRGKPKELNLLMIPIILIGLFLSIFGTKCAIYPFQGKAPMVTCNCKGIEITNIIGSSCIGIVEKVGK